MSDSVPVRSKLAKSILDQWLMLDRTSELYKCSKCFALELTYDWNLGMCPEEQSGINMTCHPSHKNGIQAYLAVDATPSQGGIAFFTGTGFGKCFYYQPHFDELGIEINQMRSTEFEMVNLLIALFIFKNEILNHKTVRIIVDNNYLRKMRKMQRHALTEAIAAILQWCDNFGCTINEIFDDNTPADEPFIVIADKLSRNKEIREWIKQMEQTNLEKSWKFVVFTDYEQIPPCKRRCLNENFVSSVNKILLEPKLNGSKCFVPESAISYECPRLRRMQYFEDEPVEFLPPSSNELKGSWLKPVLICTGIFFITYLAFKKTKAFSFPYARAHFKLKYNN